MVFYWSLCDSKSPQVTGTLLSILAELNNAVIWIVSTCSLQVLLYLVTVPSSPITMGITVTVIIIIIIVLLLANYSLQRLLVVFHWSLSDNKSPQVAKILVCFLTSLTNTVDWIVPIRPSICNSSSPLSKPLRAVPSAHIAFGITLTLVCQVCWGCGIHRLHLCRGLSPPHMSVLDMTLNNLMVNFQWCWSFGECRVTLLCHCSQVLSGPAWWHLIGPYQWVK